MKILTARIKSLGPLMLRGAGEFDPSARGVYSFATSLEFPRPSTFVGMILSSLSGSGALSYSVTNWRDLLELYKKILDKLGIEGVRGPYIYDTEQDKIYVPIRLFKGLSLVEYDQLRYYMFSYIKQELGVDILPMLFNNAGGKRELYVLKKVKDLLDCFKLDLKSIEKVGIELKDRVVKKDLIKREETMNEEKQYIYTAKYVAYPENAEIRFKLLITNDNRAKELMLRDGMAVKFGGEHRVSRLIIDDASDELDNMLQHAPREYALLLSPAPLKTMERDIEYIGELGAIGLGFSIAREKRKPMYPAVLEGSILRIRTDKKIDPNMLLKHGLYYVLGHINGEDKDEELETIGRLGYYSFIPLDAQGDDRGG